MTGTNIYIFSAYYYGPTQSYSDTLESDDVEENSLDSDYIEVQY